MERSNRAQMALLCPIARGFGYGTSHIKNQVLQSRGARGRTCRNTELMQRIYRKGKIKLISICLTPVACPVFPRPCNEAGTNGHPFPS